MEILADMKKKGTIFVSIITTIVSFIGSIVIDSMRNKSKIEKTKYNTVVTIDQTSTRMRDLDSAFKISIDSFYKWYVPSNNDSSIKWYCVDIPDTGKGYKYYCRVQNFANDSLDSLLVVHPRYYDPNSEKFLAKEKAITSLNSAIGFKKIIWVGVLFLFMIGGMFANQIFEILQTQKTQGKTTTNIKAATLEGFEGITFWMAIVVSPMIFFTTYSMMGHMSNAVAIFYSFQNGFFWFTIFGNIEKSIKISKSNSSVETK